MTSGRTAGGGRGINLDGCLAGTCRGVGVPRGRDGRGDGQGWDLWRRGWRTARTFGPSSAARGGRRRQAATPRRTRAATLVSVLGVWRLATVWVENETKRALKTLSSRPPVGLRPQSRSPSGRPAQSRPQRAPARHSSFLSPTPLRPCPSFLPSLLSSFPRPPPRCRMLVL